MARLNMAKSRVRPAICSLVRIDQTCFGRRGSLAPSGLTGLRRAFHRPEQSSEFMRYWGKEWTPEETDLVEQHREMTCRIGWKPYIHSLTLRHLLPGIATPTLLVWGGEDAITPIDSGEIYQRAFPRSR